jgi:hypothetical protein
MLKMSSTASAIPMKSEIKTIEEDLSKIER